MSSSDFLTPEIVAALDNAMIAAEEMRQKSTMHKAELYILNSKTTQP